jgi:hypothetical protein
MAHGPLSSETKPTPEPEDVHIRFKILEKNPNLPPAVILSIVTGDLNVLPSEVPASTTSPPSIRRIS